MKKKESNKTKEKPSLKNIFLNFSLEFGQKDDFLVIFFRQMAQMVRAGITIYRSLEIIGGQFANTRFKPVIYGIMHEIYQKGSPLYKAMAKFPKVFSQIIVASVRAGEEGGFLPEALKIIAEKSEKDNDFKKHLFAILTYPAFVMIVFFISVIIILKFILPTFTPILKSFNVQMPWPTKVLNVFVAGFNNPVMLAAMALLLLLFFHFIKTPKGKVIFENFLLELPIVGALMRYTAIVRFSRMYALLSASGYPMAKSLQLISTSLGSHYYEKAISNAVEEVTQGELLSKALANQRAFPSIVISMIAVGEETGDMKRLLDRLVRIYEIEIETIMEKFFALIEPVLLVFLGFVVGFLLLSVFLPMYDIMIKTGGL